MRTSETVYVLLVNENRNTGSLKICVKKVHKDLSATQANHQHTDRKLDCERKTGGVVSESVKIIEVGDVSLAKYRKCVNPNYSKEYAYILFKIWFYYIINVSYLLCYAVIARFSKTVLAFDFFKCSHKFSSFRKKLLRFKVPDITLVNKNLFSRHIALNAVKF